VNRDDREAETTECLAPDVLGSSVLGMDPAHLKWSREAVRGLTYVVTDKGPQWQWLKEMGKTEDPSCVCDGWTPQNAAHVQRCTCPWIGDGMGKSQEQASKDEEWCTEMVRFLG